MEKNMNGRNSKENQSMSSEKIHGMARAFQGSRILLSAFELGVFTALEDEAKTAVELAGKLGTGVRATDRLLNALCALGLVQKGDGHFSNTAAASQFLVEGKERYMSGLLHSSHMWDTWSSLTATVKRSDDEKGRSLEQRDPKWFKAFIEAMHSRAAMSAPPVVGQLDLTGVSRVLDVGGGSAAFSIVFVKLREGITATVFDLPNVIPLTREYIAKEGLDDKIDLVEGNYEHDEFGGGFDLVFFSAIIHANSPELNQELMHKSFRALNSGGRVVVNDFIMDEDRTSPVFGAFFALNMLVGTEKGDTYTESEIGDWMTKAGFNDIQRLEDLGPVASMVGRKKSE